MKRGQLGAVLVIVLVVAAIGGFIIFSEKQAGKAALSRQTYPTGQQYPKQYPQQYPYQQPTGGVQPEQPPVLTSVVPERPPEIVEIGTTVKCPGFNCACNYIVTQSITCSKPILGMSSSKKVFSSGRDKRGGTTINSWAVTHEAAKDSKTGKADLTTWICSATVTSTTLIPIGETTAPKPPGCPAKEKTCDDAAAGKGPYLTGCEPQPTMIDACIKEMTEHCEKAPGTATKSEKTQSWSGTPK